MPRVSPCALQVFCAALACAALAHSSAAVGQAPTLTAEQQHAAGVIVAHPVAAKAPERIMALGLVLDDAALLADESEVTVAAAQEHSASMELARLTELSKDAAGASLKMLEAAQLEEAKARAGSRLAGARFALDWGPLAAESPDARRKLLDAVVSGRSVLVRADLPGRHILGALPTKAVLDVDGIEVEGRVLGALQQLTELQSAGLLLEVQNPPLGLARGARVPLSLLGAERRGVLLPRDAVLYGEQGAYVYKQLSSRAPKQAVRYVPVNVTLVIPYGDGWLVRGVDDDDDIVVRGAGALWSAEGAGARPVDDDD